MPTPAPDRRRAARGAPTWARHVSRKLWLLCTRKLRGAAHVEVPSASRRRVGRDAAVAEATGEGRRASPPRECMDARGGARGSAERRSTGHLRLRRLQCVRRPRILQHRAEREPRHALRWQVGKVLFGARGLGRPARVLSRGVAPRHTPNTTRGRAREERCRSKLLRAVRARTRARRHGRRAH